MDRSVVSTSSEPRPPFRLPPRYYSTPGQQNQLFAIISQNQAISPRMTMRNSPSFPLTRLLKPREHLCSEMTKHPILANRTHPTSREYLVQVRACLARTPAHPQSDPS